MKLAFIATLVVLPCWAEETTPKDAPVPADANGTNGIYWTKLSFAEAQALASKHKVPLFAQLRFDGCPGCAALEQGPFQHPSVISASRKCVNIQVDYLSPDGTSLRQSAGLVGTPSLVMYRSDGTIAGKEEGSVDVAAVCRLLEAGLKPAPAPK